jgi:hypothetical protein
MIRNTVFLTRSGRILAVALAAALGLGLSEIAWGQAAASDPPHKALASAGAPVQGGMATTAAAHDPASLASPEWAKATGSENGATSHQGVKVHGHWVIDVRNPDGTLAQHRDFENSLVSGGQGFLVGLLSGYLTPGDWMIVLADGGGAAACIGASSNYCGIIHNASTYPALGYCNFYYCTGSSLSYAYNLGTDLGGPYSIVLTGSITANHTGVVGVVYSLISTCANNAFTTGSPSTIETISPATCVTQTSPEPWYGTFTQANLTPVPVTSGQIIQVKVTITFS